MLKDGALTLVVIDAALGTTGDVRCHALHALDGGSVIAGDFVDVLGEEITHGTLDEIGLLEAADGGVLAITLGDDLIPLVEEDVQIAHDMTSTFARSFGAQDDAHTFRQADFFDDLAEPGAFLGVFDLARDAAGVVQRHQDEQATSERDVGGDARPFVAHGTFGDLHHDLRTDGVQSGDVLGLDAFFLFAAAAIDFLQAGIQCGWNGVPEMQEGVFVEPDVDEHGFEALFDIADAAFENAANEAVGADTLDVVFFDDTFVEQGDAVLQFLAVDDETDTAADVAFAGEQFFDSLNEGQCHDVKSP